MKVKQLIEKLQKLDPEAEVVLDNWDRSPEKVRGLGVVKYEVSDEGENYVYNKNDFEEDSKLVKMVVLAPRPITEVRKDN